MIIVQTPLRISFLGGGTDFEDYYKVHGGAVLSITINKSIFVIVKDRYDDLICINYSKRELVDSIDKIEHTLVREAMKLTGMPNGIEITTLGDVPADGTGLGSSSSVTVGLLQAFYTYQGMIVTQQTLAEQACRIEIDTLKKPIGKQDQYIAAYGNLRFTIFNGKGIEVGKIPLPSETRRQLEANLMLFHTGNGRKADDILTEQKNNIYCKENSLSELKDLAYEGKKVLLEGKLDEFGALLDHAWQVKKGLASQISNGHIDEIYNTAIKAGAIGGKITGAGGGGFFLVYCPVDKQAGVRQALAHLKELPFRFQSDGSKVIFNYRE